MCKMLLYGSKEGGFQGEHRVSSIWIWLSAFLLVVQALGWWTYGDAPCGSLFDSVSAAILTLRLVGSASRGLLRFLFVDDIACAGRVDP